MQKRFLTIVVVAVVMALVPASAFADCAAAVISTVAYSAGGGDPVPATAAQGGSQVNYTAAPATGLPLAVEGRTERISDVLVWETGQGTYKCFSTNNNIRITYNAGITSSPSVTAPNVQYFDVYDTNQPNGLAITATTTQAQVPGGGTQTVVIVTVQQAGTGSNLSGTSNVSNGGAPFGGVAAGAGSAFRLKNLRVDATSLTPVGSNATVNVTNSNGAMAAFAPTIGSGANIVGHSRSSFTSLGITAIGAGLQNSGTGLTAKGTFNFSESAPATAYEQGHSSCTSATAANDTCVSGVANDIATGNTSFLFDAGTSLPSGVTVSWPATLSTSAVPGIGTAGYILALRNTPTCTGPGAACLAIYDTVKHDTGTAFTATIDTTTGGATGVGAPTVVANPTVGVSIGSVSGAGTATLHGFFGPSDSVGTGCGIDDAQAAAVPRFINACTAAAAPLTRNLFSGSWFTLTSNKTALLFSYVTNLFGYQTGVVVSNTGADGAVFTTTTAGQRGGLKFYFFPTNGTPFTLNTDLNAGGIGPVGGHSRGLDANGLLAPGGIFAASIGDLLTAAGQPAGTSFDGYIIVVASFQYAHGSLATISPDGTAAFSTVSVLPNAGGATRNAPGTGESLGQ